MIYCTHLCSTLSLMSSRGLINGSSLSLRTSTRHKHQYTHMEYCIVFAHAAVQCSCMIYCPNPCSTCSLMSPRGLERQRGINISTEIVSTAVVQCSSMIYCPNPRTTCSVMSLSGLINGSSLTPSMVVRWSLSEA